MSYDSDPRDRPWIVPTQNVRVSAGQSEKNVNTRNIGREDIKMFLIIRIIYN